MEENSFCPRNFSVSRLYDIGNEDVEPFRLFYEDEEAKETAADKVFHKIFKEKAENAMMGIVTAISILLAVAIFMVLPYYISSLFEEYVRNVSVMAIIEGAYEFSYSSVILWR